MLPDRLRKNRKQLLDISLRVFGKKGYHQTAVGDLAAASNIGQGTFYGYFPNKLSLFRALMEHFFERISVSLLQEPPNASQSLEEYEAQLYRIGDRLYALFLEFPELERVLFYETWVADPALASEAKAAFRSFESITRLYLQHGVEQRYLRAKLDTEVAAQAVNAVLFEAMKAVLRDKEPRLALERWKHCLSSMIIGGFGIGSLQ